MSATSDGWAVMLVAYGGPGSLDEVEGFLRDVRGGRPTPPGMVAEVKERYRRIGGGSPLLARTTAQAAALEACLGGGTPVRVGMRHWRPWVADVMQELVAQGTRRLVAIPMTPQDSRFSTGAYLEVLRGAARALAGRGEGVPEIHVARSWHRMPEVLDAFEDRLRAALAEAGRAGGAEIIFTAHSLPARVLATGDPYVDQLREMAQALAQRVGMAEGTWHVAFQSPGRTAEAWLGPLVEDVLAERAAAGGRHLVVTPIGFVCDHLEIVYDVDVVLQEKARERGVTLVRTESLNAHPSFIAALAGLVAAARGDRAGVSAVIERLEV